MPKEKASRPKGPPRSRSERPSIGEEGNMPLTMVYDAGFDQNMRRDDEKNEFNLERNQTGEFGAAGPAPPRIDRSTANDINEAGQ